LIPSFFRKECREARKSKSLSLLLVSGLVFWFILGFPYQHHNESYIWAVHLNHASFVDCVVHKMIPVANLRPLGQAVAWLTFRLSDGSVVPSQVFNFVVAVCAWLLAMIVIPERHVFALAGLVVGGTLFSGYIYIFHLHGIFYSPVLLFLAFLIRVFEQGRSKRLLVTAALCAVLAAGFHPYALLLFIAATGGAMVKEWKTLSRSQMAFLATEILVAAASIFILVILPGNIIPASLAQRMSGLLTSYRATEAHPAISVVVGILTLLTAWSLDARPRVRRYLLGGAAIAVVLAAVFNMPILFAWIVIATAKTLLQNRLSLSAMLLTASVIPAIAPTGTPTYAVYVLVLCAGALAFDWRSLEDRLAMVGQFVSPLVFVTVVILALLIRSGVQVPVLSKLSMPMLAEREKTEQLKSILEWWHTSSFVHTPIVLGQKATNPVDLKDVTDRTFLPPTSQEYLTLYIADQWKPASVDPLPSRRLLILFGGEERTGAEIVHEIPGRFAGSARVLMESR
jgi:hypothetical protein